MYAALDNITQSLNKEGYTITDPWDVVEAFEDKIERLTLELKKQFSESFVDKTLKLKIGNGYTNSFRGEVKLNVGRYGTLDIL
mgnify:CR=1 FL=1